MVKGVFSGTKNYLILGFSTYASSGINAIFWLYLAHFLTKEDYGKLGFLISIATVAFALSSLGLNRTIIVYGAKNENIYSSSYVLGLISAFIASIIVYVLIDNIYVSIMTMGLMISYLNEAYLTSKKRYTDVSKFKLIRTGLFIALGITLYYAFGINGVILGFALGNLSMLKTLYIIVRQKPNFSILKSKTRFLLTGWIGGIFTTLFLLGDKIIIGSLYGFSTLGSYQLSFQYFMLLFMFPLFITNFLLPQESQGVKNKKIKILSVGIVCAMSVASIVLIPYVIDMILPKYSESIIPIQIMSIAIIPITISAIQESKLTGMEKNTPVMLGTVLSVVVYFSFIVILGTTLDIVGFALALLISSIGRVIFSTISSLNVKS